MKLAIISDVHYGIKNDYQPFLENNKKFFKDFFFPIIHEQDIRTIVCLGDLLDRRKYVNFHTAYRLKEDFFRTIYGDWEFFWILGNHDIFYRETLSINAAEILQPEHMVIDQATEIEFGGIPILLVPWICKENREQIMSSIADTKAQICFGHFNLNGFEQQPGSTCTTGDDPVMLSKFDVVLSGHFHQRQIKGNITYVGAHSEFMWSDYAQQRGFSIFDTETRKTTFYQNPVRVFEKVYYDDAKGQPTLPRDGFESLKDKIVKVVISAKKDPVQYDWFLRKIEEAQPLDLEIVDDFLNANLTNDEKILAEATDTLGIIRQYLKQANNSVNVNKLDELVIELYKEVQTEE